jgi:uncharacterized protein (DUF427 family)
VDGVITAQSSRVECYHYVPPESVDWRAFIPSTTSRCWWKGKATYYRVRAHDALNHDPARICAVGPSELTIGAFVGRG